MSKVHSEYKKNIQELLSILYKVTKRICEDELVKEFKAISKEIDSIKSTAKIAPCGVIFKRSSPIFKRLHEEFVSQDVERILAVDVNAILEELDLKDEDNLLNTILETTRKYCNNKKYEPYIKDILEKSKNLSELAVSAE